MPRVIHTLWFEDLGLMHEPFIDTPLGELTIRQMLIVLLFGGLAWLLSSPIHDFMLKLIVGCSLLLLGLTLAFQRVKTITFEKTILLMLLMPKPVHPKPSKRELNVEPLEARALSMPVHDLESIAPTKIVGLLKDPVSGRPISNRVFEVYVEGKFYTKGYTDREGFFTVYFLPSSFGSFNIEVKPEGYSSSLEKLTVNVQPSRTEI